MSRPENLAEKNVGAQKSRGERVVAPKRMLAPKNLAANKNKKVGGDRGRTIRAAASHALVTGVLQRSGLLQG